MFTLTCEDVLSFLNMFDGCPWKEGTYRNLMFRWLYFDDVSCVDSRLRFTIVAYAICIVARGKPKAVGQNFQIPRTVKIREGAPWGLLPRGGRFWLGNKRRNLPKH